MSREAPKRRTGKRLAFLASLVICFLGSLGYGANISPDAYWITFVMIWCTYMICEEIAEAGQ